MKLTRFFLAVLTSMALLQACTEDGSDQDDSTTVSNFEGLLTVDQLNNTFFTKDSVQVMLTEGTESGKYDLVMYQVKFSSRMPVTLDMTVNGIDAVADANGYSLSGDSIIPIAMGGLFPSYTIYDLTGHMTKDSVKLSMKCGTYPLTYAGARK
jgi:hypothetical protein